MVYKSLEDLREFLLRTVCAVIKLKRPNPDDATSFELVSPAVSIGWPSGKLSGPAARQRIPGIAIGIAETVIDDGDYSKIPIELAFIVYASGTIAEGGKLELDSTGYQDLFNLMDLTARHIRNMDKGVLCLAESAISYAPDNESAGDYWLGHMQFTLQSAAIPHMGSKQLY